MIPQDPKERRAYAAEYLLGQLSPEEEAEVRAALASDAELAADVAFWQVQLAELDSALPAPEVSRRLWARIATSATAAAHHGVESLEAARSRRKPGLLKRSWPWQAATAALAAALLLFAVLPAQDVWPPAADTEWVAALQPPGDNKQPGWVVRVDAEGKVTLDSLTGTPLPGEGDIEFWTLADAAEGPRSLGLLGPDGEAPDIRLEDIGAGQLFELTLEPYGGSPTGQPTGPVLYVGVAVPTRDG